MSSDEAPKIKLYWLSASRSQRIVWLLEELKIPYEIELFHRNKQTMLAPPELEAIHPLGKSPVISITPPGENQKPVVLAESGFIAQYLCDHFPEGKNLMPKQWKDGMEGKIAGETEEWLRYHYFMHYCEGSLMPVMVFALVVSRLKSPAIPFFVRPLTGMIANRMASDFIMPNARKHLKFLDSQLASSSGKYLCGDKLTAADILMSFPLIAGASRFDGMGAWEGGSWKNEAPRVWEYVQLMEAEAGYKKSIEKIESIDGQFVSSL